MKEYKDLLKAFDNDSLLLDLHLSNIQIEEGLLEEYKQVLIASTNATKDIRTKWAGYKEWAFNIEAIALANHQEIANIQRGRRLSYKAYESDSIARYKQLT